MIPNSASRKTRPPPSCGCRRADPSTASGCRELVAPTSPRPVQHRAGRSRPRRPASPARSPAPAAGHQHHQQQPPRDVRAGSPARADSASRAPATSSPSTAAPAINGPVTRWISELTPPPRLRVRAANLGVGTSVQNVKSAFIAVVKPSVNACTTASKPLARPRPWTACLPRLARRSADRGQRQGADVARSAASHAGLHGDEAGKAVDLLGVRRRMPPSGPGRASSRRPARPGGRDDLQATPSGGRPTTWMTASASE